MMGKYIGWGMAAVVSLFIVSIAITAISRNNSWIVSENTIYAKQDVIGNALTTFINTSTTSAGITKEYADMVVKAATETNKSRYGGGGAKGTMLWIKENNPTISPEMYAKLSNIVQAGYAKIELEQNENIDMIREYKNNLMTFPNSMYAWALGFPNKWTMAELDVLSKPIMNEAAADAMKTKKMQALKLF